MINFTTFGVPAPAGSKRAFRRGDKIVITDASPAAKPWKAAVAASAGEAMNGQELYRCPLRVRIWFYMPRPKNHYRKGKSTSGMLSSTAPQYPAVKPDIDKLSRAVLDALTGVVYLDDSQIVVKVVEKFYGEPARAEVTVLEEGPPLKQIDREQQEFQVGFPRPAGQDIPAAPIVEVIDDQIDRLAAVHADPRMRVAADVWPEQNYGQCERRLRALRKQERVTFDFADRVLTVLDRTHLWYEHPDLKKAYLRADLKWLDRVRPVAQ